MHDTANTRRNSSHLAPGSTNQRVHFLKNCVHKASAIENTWGRAIDLESKDKHMEAPAAVTTLCFCEAAWCQTHVHTFRNRQTMQITALFV
jgi:hypothetical protein